MLEQALVAWGFVMVGMNFSCIFASVYHILHLSMQIRDFMCTLYIFLNWLCFFTSCITMTSGL